MPRILEQTSTVTTVLTALLLTAFCNPARAEPSPHPQTVQASVRSNGEESPDWEGLKSDTWYFMGAQVASLGVLYALPESVSAWSKDQKDNFSLNKWRENVSNPRIDKDKFYLNYILHPYWGATYYVRARERGYSQLDSFWYATFLSTFYEVGPEALFEQPSIQDLIVTPVFGALLGNYFMDWRATVRERSAARGYRTTGETWIWHLTDPLNLLNQGIDRVLGRDARLDVHLVSTVKSMDTSNGTAGPNNPDHIYRLYAGHISVPSRGISGTASLQAVGSHPNPISVTRYGAPGAPQHFTRRATAGQTGIALTLSW